jgi:predicted enzyme related to lactoylglutathione lyase
VTEEPSRVRLAEERSVMVRHVHDFHEGRRDVADLLGGKGANLAEMTRAPRLPPGTLPGMPLSLHHMVIDVHDLPALARFWAEVLHWRILSELEREVVIGPDESAAVGICFMPVTDRKVVKNRLHFDLTSGAADREAEIERILALGARRADVGQSGDESWTVLADPEGNEFCVVRPKRTLIG